MKKLTVEILKQITADPDCVKVVNALFEAIAYTETVRAIIEPKEQEVINFFKFKVKQEYIDRWPDDNIIIDSASRMYLADKEDFQIFWKEMDKFHNESGFKKKSPDHCPLLEAEELVRLVKIQVCDFLEPFLEIKYCEISHTLEAFKTYYEFIMKMFAPAVAEYQKVNPLSIR